MEKRFHVDLLTPATAETQTDQAAVSLRRQHLLLSAAIAEQAFGPDRQVYTVYYPNLKMLLLAPMSDELFKQAHDCSLIMLKDRNLNGDKSISLQEIIIDHDLDGSDRALPFTGAPGLRMLQVQLE